MGSTPTNSHTNEQSSMVFATSKQKFVFYFLSGVQSPHDFEYINPMDFVIQCSCATTTNQSTSSGRSNQPRGTDDAFNSLRSQQPLAIERDGGAAWGTATCPGGCLGPRASSPWGTYCLLWNFSSDAVDYQLCWRICQLMLPRWAAPAAGWWDLPACQRLQDQLGPKLFRWSSGMKPW